MTKPHAGPHIVVSYLTLRRAVGALGIGMPIVLFAWGALGQHLWLATLSDYYALPARDVFVGCLFHHRLLPVHLPRPRPSRRFRGARRRGLCAPGRAYSDYPPRRAACVDSWFCHGPVTAARVHLVLPVYA